MWPRTSFVPFSALMIALLLSTYVQQLAAAPADESNIVVRSLGEADMQLFSANNQLELFQSCFILVADENVREYWIQGPAKDFAPTGPQPGRAHTSSDKAVVGLIDDRLRKKHVRLRDRTLPVLVKSYQGFSQTYVESRLNGMTGRGEVLTMARWGGDTWAIRVKENALSTLYAENWLEHVEPGPYPAKRGGHLQVTKSDYAQQMDASTTPPSYLLSGQAGVAGDEIRLGLADGGIFLPHQEFTPRTRYACECEPIPNIGAFEGCPSGSDKPVCAAGTCAIPDAAECSYAWHATMMAHVAAGDGGPTTPGDYSRRGHAPNVQLGDYPPYWNRDGLAATALATQATDISIHPYESSPDDVYSDLDAKTDRLIRGATTHEGILIPARPQIWSAGTQCAGPIRSTNKNGIVIGVYNAELQCAGEATLATGPTKDGRVKPDFVLPDVLGFEHAGGEEDCCTNNDYETKQYLHTSEAAGIVGGIIALTIEALAPERTGFEYPATYKAVLAQSANDVNIIGPEHTTGFGVVDAQAATTIAASRNHWAEGVVAANKKHNYCITESIDNTRVRAALAWDDKETCASTNSRLGGVLTNDLDLRITGPGVTQYAITPPGTPLNVLMPGDHTNNVEIVDFAAGTAGNPWTVEVRGTNLESAQSYGIASSHHIEFCGEEEINAFQPPDLSTHDVPGLVFRKPVDLDELCPYVLECSRCQNGPFGLCPAFDTTLTKLPEGTVVTLIDAKGRIVSQSSERRGRHSLSIPARIKTRKLFLEVKAPDPGTPFRVRLAPTRSRTN